jgi:glycine/D-amino acid oxidase-like deaminating enzyme
MGGLAINAGHFFGNLVGALSGKILADSLAGCKPPFPIDPFRLEQDELALNRTGIPESAGI